MRVLLVLLGVLVTATTLTAQRAPTGAERFDPPQEYRALWDSAVVRCQGCTPRANFGDIAWFSVPTSTFACGLARCWGWRWSVKETPEGVTSIIFLAEASLQDRARVIHEILHVVLGTDQHPRQFAGLGEYH